MMVWKLRNHSAGIPNPWFERKIISLEKKHYRHAPMLYW
jgi:hypothetical protein